MINYIRTETSILMIIGILFSMLATSTYQQQVPTTGYCLHIANIYNNLNSKYLDIDASKGLFMNPMVNDENVEKEKWSSKYNFPKLIGSLVQICNEETNSCLSANKSGQVVLTKDVGEGDLWYLNFNVENSAIRHISTDTCLESDMEGSIRTNKCDNYNKGQKWNLVTLEETCIL